MPGHPNPQPMNQGYKSSSLCVAWASLEITTPISLLFPDILPSKLRSAGFYFFTSKTIILSFLPSNQHLPSGSGNFSLTLSFLFFYSPHPKSASSLTGITIELAMQAKKQQGEAPPFAPQRCQIVYCLSFIFLFLFGYRLLLFCHNMWRSTNLNPASVSFVCMAGIFTAPLHTDIGECCIQKCMIRVHNV